MSCSCPAWKFQKRPTQQRVCKHIRSQYPDYQPPPITRKKPKLRKTVALFVPHKPGKKYGSNMWVSEKYDGVRAILLTDGTLWTREGNEIAVPPDFVLPRDVYLDGELWLGHGRFEDVLAAVRGNIQKWKGMRYMVFDSPSHLDRPMRERYADIPTDYLVEQHVLSGDEIELFLRKVVGEGGEGIVIRDPSAAYKGGRHVSNGTKWKLVSYGTGVVTGKNSGSIEVDGSLRIVMKQHDSVEVGDKIQFTYTGKTDSGKPRFPQYDGLVAEYEDFSDEDDRPRSLFGMLYDILVG